MLTINLYSVRKSYILYSILYFLWTLENSIDSISDPLDIKLLIYWISTTYVNIGSDITLEILWNHYVHVLWKSKVQNIILYAADITGPSI